jgi:hypothetical protein
MNDDIIHIPATYTVYTKCVEFDLSAIMELNRLMRTVETALGVRLEAVDLSNGYARYQRADTRTRDVSADLPSESADHLAPVDPARTDLVACEGHSDYKEDEQHFPKPHVEHRPQRVIASDGRAVLLGGRALDVPVSASMTASETQEAEPASATLVATGEICFECRVSIKESFMLRADQLPADAAVGDEIEFHDIRRESITLVNAPYSPQLDLDFNDVSGEPEVS